MQHPQRTPALLRAGGFDTCQGLAALWAENIGTSHFFFSKDMDACMNHLRCICICKDKHRHTRVLRAAGLDA